MSGEYIWPWDDIEPEDLDENEGVPRPSSLTELAAAKEIEEFWEEGTHSILDIDRVVAADDNQVGAIVPLSPAELRQVFGTEQLATGPYQALIPPDRTSGGRPSSHAKKGMTRAGRWPLGWTRTARTGQDRNSPSSRQRKPEVIASRCPAASCVKACSTKTGAEAGRMNRPPGDLKRMLAVICHSIGVASAEVGNG
jgi:hypothetical protein